MQDVDAFGFIVENEKDLFIIWDAHLQLKNFLLNVLEDRDVCRKRRIVQGWYEREDFVSIGLVRVINVIGVQFEGFLDDTITVAQLGSTNAEDPRAASIAAPRKYFLVYINFRGSLNWHEVLLKYHLLLLLTFFLRTDW